MLMRQRRLTVSSLPTAAALSAPGAPGDNGISTMNEGGVRDGKTPDPPESKLLVVLVAPIITVVSVYVVFYDI